MSTFVPVYRPTAKHQSFLARRQKLGNKKRKRSDESSDDEDQEQQQHQPPAPTQPGPASTFHPVNRIDPYHVAQHPREDPLPPPPFPHAPIKEPTHSKLSVDEELAGLNPPLYLPPSRPDDKGRSLKLRHLDNLTTILHRCMLRGDWQRASRAWAILVRTEVAGRGIDVRRNGRWGIGAELLMRRGAEEPTERKKQATPSEHEDDDDVDEEKTSSTSSSEKDLTPQNQFTDTGFKLARDYYDRLILQYPHTASSRYSINATTFYPALFNIWIYEVQARGGEEELEEALPIAQRMDELLLSPPYDSLASLLQLRGMVALWLADLHVRRGEAETSVVSDETSSAHKHEQHEARARTERGRAREVFQRLVAADVELPAEVLGFVHGSE